MSWDSQLKAYKKLVIEEATKQYRAAILQVMIGTIMDTPVLEGRLRGDWRASIGDVASRMGSGKIDRTGSITVQAATTVLRGVKVTDDVFFVNSMPYAERIEYDGWSTVKAPQGMLRRNMAKWPTYF